MKKLNTSFFNIFNWILAGFSALLGFACTNSNGGEADEYGTPYATYEIKGKVEDNNGNPVQHIEIVGEANTGYSDKPIYTPIHSNPEEEIRSNEEGDFMISYGIFPTDTIRLVATDKNDTSDNAFLNDTIKIGINKEDYTGGGNWNKGTVKKEVTFKLKRKSE